MGFVNGRNSSREEEIPSKDCSSRVQVVFRVPPVQVSPYLLLIKAQRGCCSLKISNAIYLRVMFLFAVCPSPKPPFCFRYEDPSNQMWFQGFTSFPRKFLRNNSSSFTAHLWALNSVKKYIGRLF